MSAQSADAVTGFDTEPLHVVVARNIRAEAARRGLTQSQLGDAVGINRVGIGNRYAFNTPWTLDEVERVAKVFHMRMESLLARPEGFEPPTFWFGADDDEDLAPVVDLIAHAEASDSIAAQTFSQACENPQSTDGDLER